MIERAKLPELILSILPLTFFLPAYLGHIGVALFVLAYAASGNYRVKWRRIRGSPIFVPVLLLLLVSSLAAAFLDRPDVKFWTGYAHYQIFVFLLLFSSIQPGDWQRRAIKMFYAGAVLAATFFYLKQMLLLPEIKFFASYLEYSGNKSILLGIFLGVASAGLLEEVIRLQDRRAKLIRLAMLLYLVIPMLFFARTRTGVLVFAVLCVLVIAGRLKMSWPLFACLIGSLILLITAWKFSPNLQSRVDTTLKDVAAFARGEKISDEGIRLEMYRVAVTMIAEKPITGHGVGIWYQQIRERAPASRIESMATPHNDYLLYCAEIGLLGLAALLWILFRLLHLGWKVRRERGMGLLMFTTALIVTAMFNAAVRDTVFGMPFMLLLAVPLAGAIRADSPGGSDERLSIA
jgi:hypothetical protein